MQPYVFITNLKTLVVRHLSAMLFGQLLTVWYYTDVGDIPQRSELQSLLMGDSSILFCHVTLRLIMELSG